MIDFIRVSGRLASTTQTLIKLGAQSSSGEVHCPEHGPGGVEIEIAGAHDAEDLRTVQGEVGRAHGHAKPRNAGEAAGSSHIVQAGARVEVVATAGASSNRRAAAMAAVGQDVTADMDNQGHSIRVGPAMERLEKKVVRDVTKVT